MRIKLAHPIHINALKNVLYQDCEGAPEYIHFITTNSKEVESGDLFFGLSVANLVDEYVKQALLRGAFTIANSALAHIKVEDASLTLLQIAASYLEKMDSIKHRIAITGSVGKTTTKEFLHRILSVKYKTHKTIDNYNTRIGLALTILSTPKDTEVIILEMGMNHAGEIAELSQAVKPDIAVITNIGTSHIGNLGSRENIGKAKMEVLHGVVNSGVLFAPNDEHLIKYENLKTIGRGGDYYIAIDETAEYSYTISYFSKKRVISGIRFNNIGRHLIPLLTYSIAIAEMLRLDDAEIRRGVQLIDKSSTRYKIEEAAGITIIDDSYNSCLESVAAAIDYMDERGQDYSILLGDILECGKEGKKVHHTLGEMAGKSNSRLLFYYGNWHREFLSGIEECGAERVLSTSMYKLGDENIIAGDCLRLLNIGEALLVKGSRGMKMERIIEIIRRGGNE